MTYNEYFLVDIRILQDKKLTISEKLIFAFIWNYWRTDKVCFVSNAIMSDKLGISKRQIIRDIKHLEQMKYIETRELKKGRAILQPNKKEKEDLQSLFDSIMEKIKKPN